jgi:hypothetical protein
MTFNGSWRLRDQTKTKSCHTFFVIALGCFCYGVCKSDPTKKPEPFQDHGTFN